MGTGLREILYYAAPTTTFLVIEILQISVALSPLRPEDSVFLGDPSGRQVQFNKRLSINQADVDELVSERLPSEPTDALLLVKKPVFLGDSKWEFVYNHRAIEAKMLDVTWVEEFRKHRVPIQPGSSLFVSLRADIRYNAEEKAVVPKYFIVKVHRVIPPPNLGADSTLFLP